MCIFGVNYFKLLGFLFSVFLFYAPKAMAVVFWNEDFEGTTSQVEGRWASSCGSNWSSHVALSLGTDHKVSGSRSLKEYVNGLTTRTPEYLSETCFMDRDHPDTLTLFMRYWERTDAAFQYDPNNNKTINLGPRNTYPSWWIGHWQGVPIDHLMLGGQTIADSTNFGAPPYEGVRYTHNKTGFNTPRDKWVCVETQITMNTMGSANGILRQWSSVYDAGGNLNTTLNAEYLNQMFRGPNVSNTGNNSGTAQFQMLRIYAQHGVGYRWYDDIAVGDTRIGCTGSPPIEPPPPSKPRAPSGLRII